MPARVFSKLVKHAESRGLRVTVTAADLWALFQAQGGKCALSGEPLTFGGWRRGVVTRGSASVDRIDSSRGYEEGNIQWVHKTLNMMKKTLPDAEFVTWCSRVARHRGDT
jgi:hypothetical protein